jgi:lysophospholipase L1-like esterase
MQPGLSSMLVAFGSAGALIAATLLIPGLEHDAPWRPGDGIPVVRVLVPQARARVVEDDRDGLVLATRDEQSLPEEPATALAIAPIASPPEDRAGSVPEAVAAPADVAPADAASAVLPPDAAGLPARPPGVATALVDPSFRGMDAFYRAIAEGGIARAAHYGDSTIAADGISGTVRARLQARFGNAGPGWISAGIDPRWSMRRDVTTRRTGEWETKSILLGGAHGRYGYGGIVSTAADGASLRLTAPGGADGEPVPQARFELWAQPGTTPWASADGLSLEGGVTENGRTTWDVPQGYRTVTYGVSGGAAAFYGAVMETAGPGVVWDALGVIGVGTRSFSYQNPDHLAAQVAMRRPDLVVVMLGGNETGYPVIQKGDGKEYATLYTATVRLLRAGAPEAGCLVVTPLDQATREGDAPHTKDSLPRMVRAQQRAAEQEGCAFWNAFAAMGGDGAIVRWSQRKPPLAWADLVHLSAPGQELVGNLLADAIEAEFGRWTASGGATRPRPSGTPATPPADPTATVPGASP